MSWPGNSVRVGNSLVGGFTLDSNDEIEYAFKPQTGKYVTIHSEVLLDSVYPPKYILPPFGSGQRQSMPGWEFIGANEDLIDEWNKESAIICGSDMLDPTIGRKVTISSQMINILVVSRDRYIHAIKARNLAKSIAFFDVGSPVLQITKEHLVRARNGLYSIDPQFQTIHLVSPHEFIDCCNLPGGQAVGISKKFRAITFDLATGAIIGRCQLPLISTIPFYRILPYGPHHIIGINQYQLGIKDLRNKETEGSWDQILLEFKDRTIEFRDLFWNYDKIHTCIYALSSQNLHVFMPSNGKSPTPYPALTIYHPFSRQDYSLRLNAIQINYSHELVSISSQINPVIAGMRIARNSSNAPVLEGDIFLNENWANSQTQSHTMRLKRKTRKDYWPDRVDVFTVNNNGRLYYHRWLTSSTTSRAKPALQMIEGIKPDVRTSSEIKTGPRDFDFDKPTSTKYVRDLSAAYKKVTRAIPKRKDISAFSGVIPSFPALGSYEQYIFRQYRNWLDKPSEAMGKAGRTEEFEPFRAKMVNELCQVCQNLKKMPNFRMDRQLPMPELNSTEMDVLADFDKNMMEMDDLAILENRDVYEQVDADERMDNSGADSSADELSGNTWSEPQNSQKIDSSSESEEDNSSQLTQPTLPEQPALAEGSGNRKIRAAKSKAIRATKQSTKASKAASQKTLKSQKTSKSSQPSEISSLPSDISVQSSQLLSSQPLSSQIQFSQPQLLSSQPPQSSQPPFQFAQSMSQDLPTQVDSTQIGLPAVGPTFDSGTQSQPQLLPSLGPSLSQTKKTKHKSANKSSSKRKRKDKGDDDGKKKRKK